MKKKLYRIVCLCSLVSIVLCACGKNTNLIDMSNTQNTLSLEPSRGWRFMFGRWQRMTIVLG